MAIYFKDIEITNIDNLVPQTGLDITELWFGSTSVYTVWGTYEGTLPATINASGADMRQYQVWGNVGGVGDRTVNYFDYRNYVYSYYISSSGVETQSVPPPTYEAIRLNHSGYISILPNKSYTMKVHHQIMRASQMVAIAWYDENKTFILRDSTQIPQKNAGSYSFTATAPQNAKFAIFNFFTDDVQGIMFVKGTTPPETYVPFGYEVDMGVKSGNVMPSAPAETKTSNGITVTCDGEGRYSISGTATSDITIRFDIPEFVIPISVGAGGNGTFSMFNDFVSQNVKLYFRYNETVVDNWTPYPVNRTNTVYSLMGNKTTNGISITVTSDTTINGTISPMFTNNGESTPVKYQPYSNATTPIYIGDDPLEKDEYVDYQEQKVYRRTVNEFDKDNATLFNSYLRSNDLWTLSQATKCARIPVEPSTQYTLKIMTAQETFRINESDNPDLEPTSGGVQTTRIIRGTNRDSYTFTTSATAAVIVCQFDSNIATWVNGLMLVKGDTVPETYTPYLQPTDPPVPLPALPTCDGETVVDYAGQSAAPEKVLLKYRKKNF